MYSSKLKQSKNNTKEKKAKAVFLRFPKLRKEKKVTAVT